MGVLSRFIASGDPFDDRYYARGSVVYLADGALLSEPDSALRVATVWRAVNVLAAAIAVLPLDVFRDKGKERLVAENDPLRRRLKRKPNKLQTSYRWRHHMVGHVMLGGNYYAHKMRRFPGGPIEQVWPLDPERMTVENVTGAGVVEYSYQKKAGGTANLTDADVFHARGFSRDGVVGISVLELMRDTTNLALMNRRQRSSFVKNEMRPSVVVRFPTGVDLGDTGEKNVQAGYKKAFGGPDKAGNVLVLQDGAEISSFAINSKDAQYIESEHFLIEEFLRFLGIPAVLAGHPNKTAAYASVEAELQSFSTHCLWPVVENLEQEMTCSFYGEEAEEYVKLNLNALLRPDTAARAAFYRVMVELGILTRNEVRELEDRNPLDGLDEPLTPKNMGTGEDPAAAPAPPAGPRKAPPPAPEPKDEEAAATRQVLARARAITVAAASRLVRRELAAITGAPGRKGGAARYAADPIGWRRWVEEFYDGHAGLVVDALGVSEAAARAYCAEQSAALLAGGVAVTAGWPTERVAALERLALAVN